MTMRCPGCGEPVAANEAQGVWHKKCLDEAPRALPHDRYVLALKRIRAIIAGGRRLVAEDSTDIGNKYTICSWGLCSNDKEAWPDAIDHQFPFDFTSRGRMSPLYRKDPCPLEQRRKGMGCFYGCKGFTRLTRKEALELYDKEIAKHESSRVCETVYGRLR